MLPPSQRTEPPLRLATTADTMSTYTGLEWVHSDTAIIIAGFCSFIGLTISLYNVIKHIMWYTLPEQQLHIIRIILIVPLYCVISFLSMIFVEFSLYFEIFRDCYEAFVIYCFLVLILGYVGGEANCISLISLKAPLKHPPPLCCLPTIPLNVKFLRFCKQSCIQFIIIKPVFAVFNVIMLLTDNYYNLIYQIFVSIVYNVSYSLALYGLLLFYLACRDDIRAFSPVRKFFAVKIIIFATYWQGLFVSYAPGLPQQTAELWNDFILCAEMSLFAIIHLYSFPWWEFKTGMPSNKELMSQNARKVLSFKDVVRDVYHNIAPTYQTYVLQTDDGTKKEYKTKTYMVGNLNDPSVHNKFMPNITALKKKYGNGRKALDLNKKKGKYMLHTDDYEIDDSRLDIDIDIDDTFDVNDGDNNSSECDNNTINITPHKYTNTIQQEEEEEQEQEQDNDTITKDTKIKKKKKKQKKKAKLNDKIGDDVFDDFGDLKDVTEMTSPSLIIQAKSSSNSTSLSNHKSPDSKTNLISINIQNDKDRNKNYQEKIDLSAYSTTNNDDDQNSDSNSNKGMLK